MGKTFSDTKGTVVRGFNTKTVRYTDNTATIAENKYKYFKIC